MATRTPTTSTKAAPKPASPPTVPTGALNPKQRRFVVEYLKDHNATQAYVRAYGASPKSAETAGPRLLGDVRVKAEIVRLQDQALARVQIDTGITLERTLKEIARIISLNGQLGVSRQVFYCSLGGFDTHGGQS